MATKEKLPEGSIERKPGMEKPSISAKDFGAKRLQFITDRLNQYATRKGISIKEVNDFINDTRNTRHVTDEIDSVVEEKLHSRMCPDPSKFNIF